MRIFQSVALVGAGVLLGFGIALTRDSQANAALRKETESLRARTTQLAQLETGSIAERDQWKAEAQRLRGWGEEVHQLRAQVSGLRRELAEAQALQQQTKASLQKAQTVEKATKQTGKGEGMIPLESAPPSVGAAITREMGGGQMRILHAAVEDGKTVFGVKGQLADGRAIGMRLAEDGTVLEKSTEIPTESLPTQVQNPIVQNFGDLNISGARQIIDGGLVSYELAAKGPNMGMQIMVRDDGTILAYSAKFRAPEQKGK
ncbi:MAG: hypothetical protein HY735_11075 [Verrucomicrobia bacterium]|nr:hypothetical protein [Verrucomicrobiota bacterium]